MLVTGTGTGLPTDRRLMLPRPGCTLSRVSVGSGTEHADAGVDEATDHGAAPKAS